MSALTHRKSLPLAGDQPERQQVDADGDQRGDALRGEQHLVAHQRRGHFGQVDRVRGDDAADAERAEHGQHDHAPEIGDVGEWPDAEAAEQCGEQDGRAAAVLIGDPAHQVDAEQDAGADLEGLDHGVLVDVDDVVGAPDEGIEPRADTVGVEDDEAPGDLDQDGEVPLHAGQRQAVDARRDVAVDGGRLQRCRSATSGWFLRRSIVFQPAVPGRATDVFRGRVTFANDPWGACWSGRGFAVNQVGGSCRRVHPWRHV